MNTTPSPQTISANGSPVENMTLAACSVQATQLLCGELELNTQDGQSVLVIARGQIVNIGLNSAILAGTRR